MRFRAFKDAFISGAAPLTQGQGDLDPQRSTGPISPPQRWAEEMTARLRMTLYLDMDRTRRNDSLDGVGLQASSFHESFHPNDSTSPQKKMRRCEPCYGLNALASDRTHWSSPEVPTGQVKAACGTPI